MVWDPHSLILSFFFLSNGRWFPLPDLTAPHARRPSPPARAHAGAAGRRRRSRSARARAGVAGRGRMLSSPSTKVAVGEGAGRFHRRGRRSRSKERRRGCKSWPGEARARVRAAVVELVKFDARATIKAYIMSASDQDIAHTRSIYRLITKLAYKYIS